MPVPAVMPPVPMPPIGTPVVPIAVRSPIVARSIISWAVIIAWVVGGTHEHMDTCLRFADRKKSSEKNDNENKEELSHKWIGSHFWTKHIRAYSRAFVPFQKEPARNQPARRSHSISRGSSAERGGSHNPSSLRLQQSPFEFAGLLNSYR